ncbi:MAG: sugar phosphate isomerase/epimerase [Thermoclostridium sp.]|nr:sugar phosphate isomerase/epimerase [Thermoclostridium sp.]
MANFVLSGFADEIDRELPVQISGLKKLNIDRIEMRFLYGKNSVDYSLAEMKEIKKQLDASGISVSAIGSPIGKIGITDPFGPHLELFKHTLELAKLLDAQYIRMFSFYIPKDENSEGYRDEVLERWSAFTSCAKGAGIVLAHENEKGIYGDTAERCLEIIEAMNTDYVRAVFDPANFIQCNVETYPEAYHLLKKHIAYMHIKDALVGSGRVVPAGMGDGRLLEILSDINVNVEGEMVLSLEPHLGSFEGFSQLQNAVDTSNLEESGQGKFEVAARALRNILRELVHGEL